MFIIIFLYMNKFLQTSNLHSLCVSHAFLMYHLYDWLVEIGQYFRNIGIKKTESGGFCSTALNLKICLFSIEMSGTHPRNKSLIFLLFTCSLSFLSSFRKAEILQWHRDVEFDHLSTRIKYYSLTFLLCWSICKGILVKLSVL